MGAKYVALTTLRPKPDCATDTELTSRLAQLIRRGIDDGTLRKNLEPEALASIYGDLVNGAITHCSRSSTSTEEASALIVSVLLDGAKQ